MELVGYEVDEYVENGGKMEDFEAGNGLWWQNSCYFEDGFGFGFTEDFTTASNEFRGTYNYNNNLIFNI